MSRTGTGEVPETAGPVEFSPLPQPATLRAVTLTELLPLSTTQASGRPSLEVSFHDGLLAIRSNKASLSEVLYAVHQHTGADIAVPAGAERERVAADIGPGPAAEVLAHLLNGSRFNFLILNSASDARVLDRVILSPRGEGAMPRASAPVAADDTNADEPTQPQAAPEPTPPPSPAPAAGPQLPPGRPPDTNPQENDPPD